MCRQRKGKGAVSQTFPKTRIFELKALDFCYKRIGVRKTLDVEERHYSVGRIEYNALPKSIHESTSVKGNKEVIQSLISPLSSQRAVHQADL